MKRTTIRVGGFPLSLYERKGSTAPVFFVHGVFSNGSAWEPVLREPATNHIHAIAVDLPGHGCSGRGYDPSDYDFLKMSEMIASIIEEMKLTDVTLVGHSVGGHIANQVLGFTRRVEAVLLVATAPVQSVADLEMAYDINEDMQAIFKGGAADQHLCDAWLHNSKPLPLIRESYRQTDTVFQQGVQENIMAFLANPRFLPETETLSDKRVAFVYGERDRLIKRPWIDRLIERSVPNHSVHLVPSVAHFPHLENTNAFCSIMSGFLGPMVSM